MDNLSKVIVEDFRMKKEITFECCGCNSKVEVSYDKEIIYSPNASLLMIPPSAYYKNFKITCIECRKELKIIEITNIE